MAGIDQLDEVSENLEKYVFYMIYNFDYIEQW